MMQFNYIPRGDRVIVKRMERPERDVNDVILPDSQQRPLNEGFVIAVGLWVGTGAGETVGFVKLMLLLLRLLGWKGLAGLEPDDHVCFLDYAGQAIEIDGEEYLSMRECEIHGLRR